MKAFGQALRILSHYPATLAGSLACSLLVAVLWGGNIGALLPVFEVVLQNQTLQKWLEKQIETGQDTIAQLEKQLEQAGQSSPQAVAALQRQLRVEETALQRAKTLKPWVDRFVPHDPFQTVVVFVALLLAATVVKDFFLVCNLVLAAKLNQLVVRQLQERMFEHVLRMDPAVYQTRGTPGMMTHLYHDVQAIGTGLSQLLGSGVREPLKAVACLLGAAWISWRLLLVSLLLAPVAVILFHILGRSIRHATHRLLRENARLHQLVHETLNNIQVVQSFGMEQQESERFRRKSWDCYRRAVRIAFYNSLAKPITELLGLAIVAVAILLGTYLVLAQQTTIFGIRVSERQLDLAQLLVFYGMLVGAADPVRRMSDIFGAVQSGVAAAERFFPVLELQPKIVDPPLPVKVSRPHCRISFNDVCFSYHPQQPVLHRIQLEIPFGQTVAIVGPNGCGKTTLINLLLRFYDPDSGSISMDGVDLRKMALADLRSRIAIVSQQFPLFNDTVLDNIRYGSPQATRDDVVRAAQRAHCHRFIEEQLERGYYTVIGENGGRLSGGQRQRIALARAMLREPEILILDEATSQVDLESEQLIHKALQDFRQGRTTIIVTHRLSTLSLADRILVMDQGRILDDGTHGELLARCPLYRRLHDLGLRQTG